MPTKHWFVVAYDTFRFLECLRTLISLRYNPGLFSCIIYAYIFGSQGTPNASNILSNTEFPWLYSAQAVNIVISTVTLLRGIIWFVFLNYFVWAQVIILRNPPTHLSTITLLNSNIFVAVYLYYHVPYSLFFFFLSTHWNYYVHSTWYSSSVIFKRYLFNDLRLLKPSRWAEQVFILILSQIQNTKRFLGRSKYTLYWKIRFMKKHIFKNLGNICLQFGTPVPN